LSWSFEGQWKFQGGEGFHKPKLLIKETLKLKQNFLVVGEGDFKIKPPVGGAWIFSGTTHYIKVNS